MAPGAYRSLGLISNPFFAQKAARESDYPGTPLVAHAAANRLLVAVDAAADDPASRPIWVEKAGGMPVSAYIKPLAETLRVTGSDALGMKVLTGYVPLDMMRAGRVRAVLSVFAERVSGVEVDLTIAAWLRRVLSQPDTKLPEYAPIAECDLAGLDAALADSPAATVERYFGPPVDERAGAEDVETLMRLSVMRQDALEADPDETAEADDGGDEAPTDALAEVFATPLVPNEPAAVDAGTEDEDEAAAVPPGEPDDGLPGADDLVAYVVAYTSAHLSPVVARALRAYRAQGISSMAQELKITKAPTKTLVALCRLATCHHRKIAILIDRFDIWPVVPEDLRLKIIGTLSQIRHALRETAVLVMLSGTGQTPELEEQFAAATRVLWDMLGLAKSAGREPSFDAEVAQGWLDDATLAGHERIVLAESPLAALLPADTEHLAPVADRLAAAIDDAAVRGLSKVDELAVERALTQPPAPEE